MTPSPRPHQARLLVADMSSLQQLSVIIPFAPGDFAWKDLLSDLEKIPASAEIILVAANETEKLQALKFETELPLRIIVSALGRAVQMNAGARAARNNCLWFLHADSRVDAACLNELSSFDYAKKSLGFFGLRFQNDGPRRMGINTLGVWFRSRFLRMPFGDQGFVISKSCFEMLGGYREDLSSGEDHALVWKARKNGVRLQHLNASIQTSARKYMKYGWGKTTRMHLRTTWQQARQFSKQEKSR